MTEIDDILSGKIQSFGKLDSRYNRNPFLYLNGLIANLLDRIQTLPSEKAMSNYFKFIATLPEEKGEFAAVAGVEGYGIYLELRKKDKIRFDLRKLKGFQHFCGRFAKDRMLEKIEKVGATYK